ITVVTNLPPVANAGADQTLEDSNLNTNEPVLLNGTGSFDPDGTIVDYKWFNNGELVGLSAQPTIVLPLGLHTIGLTVTDNNGGQASDTMTVEIFSVPIANAGPDQSVEDTDMNGSASIALDGTGSTLAYSSIIAYDWSLNGTTIATGPVASVDLPVGTHNIVLTVMADRGLTTTATDAVIVNITEPDLRVQNGLLALYEFNEGSGSTVTDTSGVGTPLNLVVANPGNVTWNASGLTVNSATIISSSAPATKIIDAARSSNEFTFEAWVTTANTTQNGPARIMSISVDPSTRNTTLGQGAGSSLPTAYNGRVRTTTTSDNGVPNLTTSAGQAATSLRHVVMTRSSSGVTTIYVNGNQVAAANIGGNLSNWNTSYPFMLANELTLDRPWLGTFHLVAVYGRALTPGEIAQNYQAGS
ncbi:MAG: hypothetical protein KC708_17495, partial [Anaerolineae bacterium]|nr:hypothetical protein [Anaerolineae bacterium]